jgi:hypothetical protein
LTEERDPWEALLIAASALQRLLPEAVLVGGTAAALRAGHRVSLDADHVIPDLRTRFDAVLAELEGAAGWTTARVTRPVVVLGSLHGIETGVRQLRRSQPLEVETVVLPTGETLRVPTAAEMLRIKAWMYVTRNAQRDLLDVVALADYLGDAPSAAALATLDELYQQPSGASVAQQLVQQLAEPRPTDTIDGTLTDPSELYRAVTAQYATAAQVLVRAGHLAALLLRTVAPSRRDADGSAVDLQET